VAAENGRGGRLNAAKKPGGVWGYVGTGSAGTSQVPATMNGP